MLTQNDYSEWIKHPATEEFFKFLDKVKSELLEDWSNSAFVGESADITIQRNSHALGEVEVLTKLRNLSYEDIIGTLYESKE